MLYGTARTFHSGTQRVRFTPSSSYVSVCPANEIVCAASGCGKSHGAPSRSHASGCSTCCPSANAWRKMPYS